MVVFDEVVESIVAILNTIKDLLLTFFTTFFTTALFLLDKLFIVIKGYTVFLWNTFPYNKPSRVFVLTIIFSLVSIFLLGFFGGNGIRGQTTNTRDVLNIGSGVVRQNSGDVGGNVIDLIAQATGTAGSTGSPSGTGQNMSQGTTTTLSETGTTTTLPANITQLPCIFEHRTVTYAAHCSNGKRDPTEEATDCGGNDCQPCFCEDLFLWNTYVLKGYMTGNESCTFNSTYRQEAVGCWPHHCFNRIADSNEEGLDCGGDCMPCLCTVSGTCYAARVPEQYAFCTGFVAGRTGFSDCSYRCFYTDDTLHRHAVPNSWVIDTYIQKACFNDSNFRLSKTDYTSQYWRSVP